MDSPNPGVGSAPAAPAASPAASPAPSPSSSPAASPVSAPEPKEWGTLSGSAQERFQTLANQARQAQEYQQKIQQYESLGYSPEQIRNVLSWINENSSHIERVMQHRAEQAALEKPVDPLQGLQSRVEQQMTQMQEAFQRESSAIALRYAADQVNRQFPGLMEDPNLRGILFSAAANDFEAAGSIQEMIGAVVSHAAKINEVKKQIEKSVFDASNRNQNAGLLGPGAPAAPSETPSFLTPYLKPDGTAADAEKGLELALQAAMSRVQ